MDKRLRRVRVHGWYIRQRGILEILNMRHVAESTRIDFDLVVKIPDEFSGIKSTADNYINQILDDIMAEKYRKVSSWEYVDRDDREYAKQTYRNNLATLEYTACGRKIKAYIAFRLFTNNVDPSGYGARVQFENNLSKIITGNGKQMKLELVPAKWMNSLLYSLEENEIPMNDNKRTKVLEAQQLLNQSKIKINEILEEERWRYNNVPEELYDSPRYKEIGDNIEALICSLQDIERAFSELQSTII